MKRFVSIGFLIFGCVFAHAVQTMPWTSSAAAYNSTSPGIDGTAVTQVDVSNFVLEQSVGDVSYVGTLTKMYAQMGQKFTSAQNKSAYNAFGVRIQNLENFPVTLVVRFENGRINIDTDIVEQQVVKIPANTSVLVQYDINVNSVANLMLKALPPAFSEPHMHLPPTKSNNSMNNLYAWYVSSRMNAAARIRVSEPRWLQVSPPAGAVIDEFGQCIQGSWTNKVSNLSDLINKMDQEQADLLANPPVGGYTGTNLIPAQTATGKWRTQQLASGKWYFVSPTGKPFWAFGLVRMNAFDGTMVQGRQQFFSALPDVNTTPYHYMNESVSGFGTLQSFSFFSYNHQRVFGANWLQEYKDLAVERAKSWGFNTFGATSSEVHPNSDVPFIEHLSTRDFPTRMQVTKFRARTLPDPYATNFQSWMQTAFASQLGSANGRTNFLGVTVDGETPWGNPGSNEMRYQIALGALNAASSQPAKARFLQILKNKYRTISKFNSNWKTSFASWTSLDAANALPNPVFNTATTTDMKNFTLEYLRSYYSKVKNALTAINCSGLYLGGMELYAYTPEMAQAQNSYVDAFSIDIYMNGDEVNWNFPDVTKPILITEFSFNANDRGAWGNSWPATANQADRASRFSSFLQSALANPKVVGALFFRYMDQPALGRQNLENGNYGMVSIANVPHTEMVSAARNIGRNLYSLRGQ